jgi:hypothetical protein
VLPVRKHKNDNKQKMKTVKRCSYESVRKEICMDMDRRLKWILYALLTIVSLVALSTIAYGTYIYVSYNDKSGIFVASGGVVCICFETVALILYFRRAKTTESK